MLRHYRIELVDPKKELKTLNYWFNKQVGLNVKVTKR